MDSAEILFCLLDSLDNCDLATEASVYSTVVDFAKSNKTSSNCVGLVSNAIISFLQVSHISVNHQLSLLRLLSLIISSYAIFDDVVLTKNEDGEIVNKLEIVNATNFTINGISQDDMEFFDNLSKFIINEYVCLKHTDPRRVALLQVLVSLVFLIPEKLVETLLGAIQDTKINGTGGISSVLVAISAISKIFPEIVSKKGHDIIVELLSLLHKVAKNDSTSKSLLTSSISRVELVRCLACVADALRSNYIERKSFAGLVGTAFDALLNDWVPTIQKDKEVFYLSFPTLETLGHLAQVIDNEQLTQHAPKLLSVYLQILNSLLSKKNKYFPTLITTFSETCRDNGTKFDDLLPNNIYTLRWRQYHSIAASATSPLLTSKSETIALSLHYSILSGFKLFLDRCHTVCCGIFEDQNSNSSLFNVLINYCAIFHRLYAPAILPGYIAHLSTNEEMVIEKELFESENGYLCRCWNHSAVHDIITTHYELILCWKSLIKQDLTREAALKFLFENIDIKSANRLSSMFIFRHIIIDLPFEKVSKDNGRIISISECSNTALGSLLYRLARTTLEQGLDYCIAFILSDIICELAKYRFLHIGSYEQFELNNKNECIERPSCNKFTWVSPSPSSAEMLTYFLRLLAVPESKAKSEHVRHIQRHRNDHIKNTQTSEGAQMPVIYPPSLWDLRNNAQYILSEELTSLVPDLLWPLLIDAVNHLKLGSAMPIVCESLCKSCNNLYQRSTPDMFFSAFKHKSTQYLSVSDPYKIFVWLCMYAHDPYVYNGVLAYWSLRCLKWIAPMIIPSHCNWSCLPSQRLQNVIEVAESVIMPSKVEGYYLNRNESSNLLMTSTQHACIKCYDNYLSFNIDINLWFTLIDECISLILSGMSDYTSETIFDNEINSFRGGKEGLPKFGFISMNLMGVLTAIFSACKDIRSDKVQKHSDTPTEFQRAGMYSLLGLLLREIDKNESCSECMEASDSKVMIGKFILNVLDGVLIPDLATYSDSNVTGSVSSGSNINSSLAKVGDDFRMDVSNSNDVSFLKDLSKQISDIQHFFHAIGLATFTLQTSCGRGLGYAGNGSHFVLISEYLLELIKSDSANKRSGAFSFFGKSLAVLQAEQLRSALILSLGHAMGEANISVFNSSIDTVKKILAVLESAIKEEKEQPLHCSTLRAVQVAFSAFSLIENNEITLSSRINSVMSKYNSGDGFKMFGENFDLKDASVELFNSFRDTIFPYILTIIVFSETIELPPVPLDSTLLLKAASGMPYNTSGSISSQRIHTDPSGPYIRSMVRYRDISISNLDLLNINDSDSGSNTSSDETQSKCHSSMGINRNYGCSYVEEGNLLFGPFNLTLAVLSVLSENPLMSSDNTSDVFLSENFLKILKSDEFSTISPKDVISNIVYMKANNGVLDINKINGEEYNIKVESRNSVLDHFSSRSGSMKSNKFASNSMKNRFDTVNEVVSDTVPHSSLKQNNNSDSIDETKDSIVSKETKTGELNQGNMRVLNSTKIQSSGQNNKNQPSSLVSHSVTQCIANQAIPINSAINSFSKASNNTNSFVLGPNSCSNVGVSNITNTNNVNNSGVSNNSTNSANPVTFNNLLLYALETSISLISFPSPLVPQHIPLVINSCLTILVSVSSRIKFRCINEDFLLSIYTKNCFGYNLPPESLGIVDGGFKLKEIMNIIEDTLNPTNPSEVSAFKILDSLDRLYLNIYKSHMPSWVGLSHLLEGLLGLGATASSPVLRCLCIHITYCLVCEAPLVEILQNNQMDFKGSNCVSQNNSDHILPPKGTWISWMHCVALILGRTCDSCIYVRLIAFECIKECMKRCVWTQCIDASKIRALEFEDEMVLTLKSANNEQLRAVLRGGVGGLGDGVHEDRLSGDRDRNFSDVQSMILPHTYLNLLFTLANNIPAFCLRPLCQHILPSFHDVDRVTAYSSVETVRVFFTINKHILESESFSSRIISSLFDEIMAIKDSELQHFVYLLVRNVVSRQFQSGINEIFNKCIHPRRYINYGPGLASNNEEYIENVIINHSEGKKSEWTTIDMVDSGKDSVLRKSNKSFSGNKLRNFVNIICTVNPTYSKAISYIGRDKVLLLESFRYLTDILNNTEQRYPDIVELNEILCVKVASLTKIHSNGSLINFLNPSKDSLSPTLHVSHPVNVNNTQGKHQFQLNNEQFIPISTLSSLSDEHIYLRSSTLVLDILLQTNDSGIKIIAKKHFPELVSTLLLRCCSTLGYINMGALESSNALRSLFLALYDTDALLTFFDANQLKLSLIRSDEFDSAIIKLLCYIFTQRPSIYKLIFSFVRPFLNRINSVYSMGAIILLSPIPLGIYINDFSNSSRVDGNSENIIGLYDPELLETVLNIIKVSNNPYAKKNGFVFFQWYFWLCLESNIFPKEEFISKYINVCFINVIGSSMFKNDAVKSRDLRGPLMIYKIEGGGNDASLDLYNHEKTDLYKNIDYCFSEEDSNENAFWDKDGSVGEGNFGIFYAVIKDDPKHDKTGDSEVNSSFIESEDKLADSKPVVKEIGAKEKVKTMMINSRSLIIDLIRECIISLRYLVCIVSKMDLGLPLLLIPNHPPVNLEFATNKDICIENRTYNTYMLFIKCLFCSKISDRTESSERGTIDFEGNSNNRISEIFMDFITNSDLDVQVTTEKLYLLLDVLILIKQKWDISEPDKNETDLIRFYIKKLLIPLLVRLEEPTLKLTRPVWRAIQLILSIILTEYEWGNVINEIKRKFIIDGLIVQNSMSSPLSATVSPSSFNKGKVSRSFSGVIDKSCYSDSTRKHENKHLEEKSNYIKHVEFFTSPYCESVSNDGYKFILPANYRKSVNNLLEDYSLIDTISSENMENNSSLNKFIQIKYSGECEFLKKFLLPISNPVESNNYQQFLNCIIPFIISSDILREASKNLKHNYQLSENLKGKISNTADNEISNLSEELIIRSDNDISKLEIIKPTLRELGKRIEDCHLYLNRCRYYFPKELWEITETAFSTIPKELDRIKKEAETQHLLFNRNIFGEMVSNSAGSNEGVVGIIYNKSFLNRDFDFPGSSPEVEQYGGRFSFSYSPNSAVISIPSFAKVALSHFNTLWGTGKNIRNKCESKSYGNVDQDILGANSQIESKVTEADISNSEEKYNDSCIDLNKETGKSINGHETIPPNNAIKDKKLNFGSLVGNKLPDTLSQQLDIKKMELISEYIKYPSVLKPLEKYFERNEETKVAVEGTSAILASTFIKYISIEFFQHFYTSEILMLLAYREIYSHCDSSEDSLVGELEHGKTLLENEVLMDTIDKLLSLESLISAICKQISSFVAHSQSPSRHRFAKALANLVYISYKP